MQGNKSGATEDGDGRKNRPDPSLANSVLTNVAPPSALPSFLASSTLPSGPLPVPAIPSGPTPPLPQATSPLPPPQGPCVPSSSPAISATQPSADPQPAFTAHCNDTRSVVTSHPQLQNSHDNTAASASVDLSSSGKDQEGQEHGQREGQGHGWLGWIRGTVSNVSHRVAERAKTSMDSMITTLDPQMREFIYSGGDMDLVVASDKEVKVGAIREAFQITFGKATVCGVKAEAVGMAAQPVGFASAHVSAESRINHLKSSGLIHPRQPIVAIENFIVELQPHCWFELGLLLLNDPGEDIILQTYTQMTPVPLEFVGELRSATPQDYPFRESGFAVTIGEVAGQNLQVDHSQWQETLTGVSRREALLLAGRTLAGLYKSRLPNCQ